jgi:hypothetical protein
VFVAIVNSKVAKSSPAGTVHVPPSPTHEVKDQPIEKPPPGAAAES